MSNKKKTNFWDVFLILVLLIVFGVDYYIIYKYLISPMTFSDNKIKYLVLILIATIFVLLFISILLIKTIRREKNRRKALDVNNNAKASFLFNMSHDIRTPINSIIGFTDIAINNSDDKEKVGESLDKIKSSSKHLLDIINDTLEVSKIDAGKVENNNRSFDLAHCLEVINPMLISLAESKNINYTYDLKGIKDYYVSVDTTQLDEILINLINNAIMFTPCGGNVSVVIKEIDANEKYAKYSFEIADNGVGMSKEYQKHLFEEFAKESNEISKEEGTGLGLAISKRLIDNLGGNINVVSELGKGSTFTLILKLRLLTLDEIVEYNNSLKEVIEIEGINEKKALVVEDNELSREIVVDILRNQGMSVEEAKDGKEALDLIKERGVEYFDFILMDIQMPVMDGYTCTKEIRRLEGGRKAIIIALSANAFLDDKEKSINAGMNDHISKPVSIDKLEKVLKKYL